MDGSLLILALLLVGFLALGMLALAVGEDSREVDPRAQSLPILWEGE